MPKYVALVTYTTEAWAKILEHGQNREEAVKQTVERAGGKLDSVHWTMSHYDGIVFFEVPDAQTAMAFSAIVGASGTFSHFELHPVFSADEHAEIVAKARGLTFYGHKHPETPRHN